VETAESQYNRAPSIIRRREGLDYASKRMEETVNATTHSDDDDDDKDRPKRILRKPNSRWFMIKAERHL